MISLPYFYIITPVKNGEKYISSFMNSLLNQTFQNWEIMIIDDSSDDNSYKFLKSYENISDRITVVSLNLKKSFPGPYAARNYALNFIRGKYVLFWDIDDYWVPSHLYNYYNYLSSHPEIDLLYSSYFRFYHHSIANDNAKVLRTIRFSPPPFLLHFLLRFCNPLPMLTVCVSKNLLDHVRFQPVGHEDFLFWHQLIEKIPVCRISKVSFLSAYYRESPVSQSSNKVLSFAWIFSAYKLFGYSKLVSFLAYSLFIAYQVLVALCGYIFSLIYHGSLK